MIIAFACVVAFHASWCTNFGLVVCRWFRRGTSDELLIQ